MQLKSLWSKLFICITCIHVKTIDVFMCVSLSFVPVVLSPSFVFLVCWSLDLMFCKCTYWDPRITTLRVVSSYMALVYVTALQALIWFAVAWKSVGNHFTLAVYTFLKSDKREKKHAETNTDILVLFINVCEFVCVCAVWQAYTSLYFSNRHRITFSQEQNFYWMKNTYSIAWLYCFSGDYPFAANYDSKPQYFPFIQSFDLSSNILSQWNSLVNVSPLGSASLMNPFRLNACGMKLHKQIFYRKIQTHSFILLSKT